MPFDRSRDPKLLGAPGPLWRRGAARGARGPREGGRARGQGAGGTCRARRRAGLGGPASAMEAGGEGAEPRAAAARDGGEGGGAGSVDAPTTEDVSANKATAEAAIAAGVWLRQRYGVKVSAESLTPRPTRRRRGCQSRLFAEGIVRYFLSRARPRIICAAEPKIVPLTRAFQHRAPRRCTGIKRTLKRACARHRIPRMARPERR